MSSVGVRCEDAAAGWTCHVTLSEGGSQSEHEVSVSREELGRLGGGLTEPTRLVEASFAYLLEREPKESILRRFAISDIARYFPDYARVIGARLERPG